MPYFPVSPVSDLRGSKQLTPLKLQNWYVQPIKAEAAQNSGYELLPTPGLTPLVDMGAAVQGLYAEDGVRNGELHVSSGGSLYSVSSLWSKTNIGSLLSSGTTTEFAGLRDRLLIVNDGNLFRWDGTTFSQVTDSDLPSNVTSVSVISQRAVITDDTDTISFSDTLDATSWEALGFATAEQYSDRAWRTIRLGGQLFVPGKESLEFWRPTGDSTLPIANITNSAINESQGVLGRHAICSIGDKAYFVGGDRSLYVASGLGVQSLPPNRELEDILAGLSEDDQKATTCFGYRDGSHHYFVLRPVGHAAQVYSITTGLWHTRKSWNATTWKVKFHAKVYGIDVVALEGDSWLYKLDPDVFSDNGETVERIATIRVGLDTFTTIGSMAIDLRSYSAPLTGQGSSPQIMFDVGLRNLQAPDLPTAYVDLMETGSFRKPVYWGIGGPYTPADGVTMTMRMTDPIGCSLKGLWLNEGDVNGYL